MIVEEQTGPLVFVERLVSSRRFAINNDNNDLNTLK